MNRRTFMKRASLAGVSLLSANQLFGQDVASKRVRIAIMGCHAKGRGNVVMQALMKVPGVEIATVCDVDARARVDAAACVAKIQGREPKQVVDIRKVMEDKEIDGVVTATPEQWHAPAALMAMKAGKAIYVEKPVSHNPHEGEILVEASKRYKVAFQMGSQRRSSRVYQAVMAEIRKGIIGEPRFVRAWYLTRRSPIGKGKQVAVPEWLDWELWQGPAPRRPYQDNLVHYNWHWFRDYGTGECGNNATHYVDVGRWALDALYPERVTCGGGRLFHEGDDWQWFDTQTVTFEFPGRKFMTWEGCSSVGGRPPEGVGTGAMVYGLKGSILFAPNDTAKLFDAAGKELKEWNPAALAGDAAANRTNPTAGLDVLHTGNWVDAIRAQSQKTHAPAEVAHASTLLTHLGNIALRTGETIRVDPVTGGLVGKTGQALWARDYAPGWEMKI